MRNRKSGRHGILFICIVLVIACVKPFEPPAIKSVNQYLIAEGNITTGAHTKIRLSHTRNLSDTITVSPVNGATVEIISSAGETFQLADSADGNYVTNAASVVTGNSYRVRILTAGKEYLSEFVEVKNTPPVDSLQWNQDDNVFIYLNTHDPSNNTRYYRWDFIETSEYHVPFRSILDYRNGEIVFIEPEEYHFICYKDFYSTDLLIGSSAALSEDVIKHALIAVVPNDGSRMSVRYSILVRQYAITKEAYEYFRIVKQTSQQTGDIFDPQPSQVKGNIHCTNNPEEPVIGFITASSVTEKRIFINNGEIKEREGPNGELLCEEFFVNRDSALYYLRGGDYLPAYYVTNGPLALAKPACVDCRVRGGVIAKPSFW